jgi:hypothetical protein
MDSFILRCIGEAVRTQFDDIANAPLPEHLVELVDLLNDQGQGEAGPQPRSGQPLNAFIEKARDRLVLLQQALNDTQQRIDHTRRLLAQAVALRSDPPIRS